MTNDQIIIYQTANEETAIDVKISADTVWLNQSQITELFKRDRSVITKHLNNIFKEGELEEKSNVQKMHIANADRPVAFYSLDVIISHHFGIFKYKNSGFQGVKARYITDII